jgi:hypothetical protein
MINKSRIDQDQTTNSAAVVSILGAAIAAINGVIHHHDLGDWLPTVLLGGAGGFSQWLQGTPSKRSQAVASVLQLDGSSSNANLVRSAIDRLLASGVVPGLGVSQPETMRPDIPRRLGVDEQARAIANQMERRLAARQPQSQKPMTREDWMAFNRADDARYPEIIQTGHDPDEIGPSTTAR